MMKFIIKADTLIEDIQKGFNNEYPYLWLDLFNEAIKSSSEGEKVSSEGEKVSSFLPLDKLGDSENNQVIDINEQRTISELEEDFRQMKLFIRVLRKSGRSWVNTSLTKDWTLAQQNEEGEMMSSINEAMPRKEMD